jgi:predicted kinase
MFTGGLYCLIGCPRSGKSTIAEGWLNHKYDIFNWKIIKGTPKIYDGKLCRLQSAPRIVVCADKIRIALHGQRFAGEAEQFVHAIKNMIIRMYLDQGYSILVDGTHTTKSSLKELLLLDKNLQCAIIDTDKGVCEDRARECGQTDLITEGVIDRMYNQLTLWKNNPQKFIQEILEELK